MPARFRALRLHRTGEPVDVLAIEEITAPPLGDDEVRIKVDAFALNRADWLYCHGDHYTEPTFPSGIGSECAGTVVGVGRSVDPAHLSRRVCTVPFHNPGNGVQGEYATVPAVYLAPWPRGLDAVSAASVWMQYLTAYFALIAIADLKPADTVLITAASSSAGLAAVQMAKQCGARVIATSRNQRKAARIEAAGADHVLALDGEEPLASSILQLTNGAGVRVVFDPIAGDLVNSYADALADQARVFLYGLLSGQPTQIDIVRFVRRAAVIHPYSMFNHVRHAAELHHAIDFIQYAIAGGLRPMIDQVFAFTDAIEAYRRLDSQDQVGKIVVDVTGGSAWPGMHPAARAQPAGQPSAHGPLGS